MYTIKVLLLARIYNIFEIYPDAKGVPGSMVIRITATRHIETIALLQREIM
jgi:hypothetical protein